MDGVQWSDMKKITFAFSFLMLAVAIAALPTGVANAAGTLSIDVISPNSTVPAGTAVSFQVVARNFLTDPKYTITDSLPGSTISNSSIRRAP